ncbi:hypothetical protein Tco_0448263 [Tanacetum coccineum]
MQLVLDCLIIASIIDVKSVSYGVIIVFSYLMFGSNGEVQRIENKAKNVVRRWSTAIDRWSGGGSDDDWPGHVAPSPVMVTCGTANDWVRWWRYEVLFYDFAVAGNVWWQYDWGAGTTGQSEHDTCPKRVIRGCQACVSPRLSCGDPRQ